MSSTSPTRSDRVRQVVVVVTILADRLARVGPRVGRRLADHG
jgi:hypothetical protein